RCETALVVICPDAAVAEWAAQPISLGPGGWMQPLVMGPRELAALPALARAQLESVTRTAGATSAGDAEQIAEVFRTLWTDDGACAVLAFLCGHGVDVPGALRTSLSLRAADRLPVGLG